MEKNHHFELNFQHWKSHFFDLDFLQKIIVFSKLNSIEDKLQSQSCSLMKILALFHIRQPSCSYSIFTILQARVFGLFRPKWILGNCRPTRQPQPLPPSFSVFSKVLSPLGILPKFRACCVPRSSQLPKNVLAGPRNCPWTSFEAHFVLAPFKIHLVKATSQNAYEVLHLDEFSRQVSSLLPPGLMMPSQ